MPAPTPFDPRLARLHRARAAAGFEANAFLHARVAADLAERLEAIPRRFEHALALGAPNIFVNALSPDVRERIGSLVLADTSAELARSHPSPDRRDSGESGPHQHDAEIIGSVAIDPENLPFAEQSFDLIVSPLLLHTVNDLPGALVQLRRALRPDGLFLGALFAGETLHELRSCLIAAESELRGGAGPRVAPFADMLELAGLLQRAGFALPAADRDKIVVRYAEPLKLLSDQRAMGETNALTERAGPLTRGVLFRALALYNERYADPDGRVRATFEIVTLAGWAPHESQQKPLKPGSAKARLAEALGARENALPREE